MTTSTSPTKRTHQLTASPDEVDHVVPFDLPAAGGRTSRARDQRFDDGVRTLRVGGASVRLEERLLMVLGGIAAPLGLVVVLLGWWGAAHSPYVFEQLPYLISGGLLGLGLIFLGAFLYFAHWMTALVKEHRVQSVAVLDALQRLQDQMAQQAAGPPLAVPTNGTHPHAPLLVATERGTMAHRQDCVVVAGKGGLRRVSEEDGLAPCKLCEPFSHGVGTAPA